MTQEQLDDLVALLDLEPIEVDYFRGRSPAVSLQRVFGGQVAGQALVAAGRTVPEGRAVHSLHAYFLVGGDPTVPILYTVDRMRDGRSFSARRVIAVQHGRPIFALSASFHVGEAGLDHQDAMPEAPDPERLPPVQEVLAPYEDVLGTWWTRPRPFDLRYVGEHPWVARQRGGPQPARSQVWMRAAGRLPDPALLHVCALAYASDLTLLDSVLLAHGRSWGEPGVTGASPRALDTDGASWS